jgi:hypothetical protein
MKLKKFQIFLSATIFLLLINIVQVKAQPGTPTACDGDPDVECPIDAPVILLVAGVLFLSVKKLYAVQNSAK